jgi:hypothetical protein
MHFTPIPPSVVHQHLCTITENIDKPHIALELSTGRNIAPIGLSIADSLLRIANSYVPEKVVNNDQILYACIHSRATMLANRVLAMINHNDDDPFLEDSATCS